MRPPHLLVLSVALVFGLVMAACGGATEVTESATVGANATTSTSPVAAAPSSDAVATTATAPPETASFDRSNTGETDAGRSELFAGDFVDLNGEVVDFGALEGQDVVLWFWAPW